eukprot:2933340-Prymnesium_polylepis.1
MPLSRCQRRTALRPARVKAQGSEARHRSPVTGDWARGGSTESVSVTTQSHHTGTHDTSVQ